jgi:outer membrane protein assembly factor BamB
MTSRVRASALLMACAVLAAGCSWFGSEKKPAPLTEFKAQVTPKIVWTASVGKSGTYVFSPEAEQGKVYAAAADGTISVVEEDSGKILTRLDAKQKISAGIISDGDRVLIGTLKGEVIALDASGKPAWSVKLGGELLAPASVAGKFAIVRTADGRLFSLALADGKRRWVYQRQTPALLLRSDAGLVVTSTNVVAGYPGGKLIALDLEDGKLVWEVTVAQPRGATELERVADIAGVPVIDAGRICAVAFQGKAACFDIQGGNTVWTRDVSSATGLAVDAKNVYITDDQDNVLALDKGTGASVWKQDKFTRRKVTAPMVSGGNVIVGDGLGYLHVLSPEDGSIIGRIAIDGSRVQAIVAAKSGLLVQTSGGSLALVRF